MKKNSDESLQREYYKTVASTYHERHVSDQDEHALALDLLVMIARHHKVAGSFLDVGSGTGRAMKHMALAFPEALIQGIEPVAELRQHSNNIGQGSSRARNLKKIIKKLGCWNLLVWFQTKGKMSKWSEGDGLYYSFCAFDTLPLLSRKFSQVQVMNTQGTGSADLLSSVSHVAIVARKKI